MYNRFSSILEVNWVGKIEEVDVLKERDSWIQKLFICHTSWLNNQLLCKTSFEQSNKKNPGAKNVKG